MIVSSGLVTTPDPTGWQQSPRCQPNELEILNQHPPVLRFVSDCPPSAKAARRTMATVSLQPLILSGLGHEERWRSRATSGPGGLNPIQTSCSQLLIHPRARFKLEVAATVAQMCQDRIGGENFQLMCYEQRGKSRLLQCWQLFALSWRNCLHLLQFTTRWKNTGGSMWCELVWISAQQSARSYTLYNYILYTSHIHLLFFCICPVVNISILKLFIFIFTTTTTDFPNTIHNPASWQSSHYQKIKWDKDPATPNIIH